MLKYLSVIMIISSLTHTYHTSFKHAVNRHIRLLTLCRGRGGRAMDIGQTYIYQKSKRIKFLCRFRLYFYRSWGLIRSTMSSKFVLIVRYTKQDYNNIEHSHFNSVTAFNTDTLKAQLNIFRSVLGWHL